MAESPTQRTLRECRKRGWPVDVAEHWVPSHLNRAVIEAAKRLSDCQNMATVQAVHDAVARLREGLPGKRRDMFGCIDVVAIDVEARQIVGIQACAVGDQRRRWNKIRLECLDDARAWIQCGQRLEVWGWGQYLLKRGGKAKRWRPTVTPVTAEDLADVVAKPF